MKRVDRDRLGTEENIMVMHRCAETLDAGHTIKQGTQTMNGGAVINAIAFADSSYLSFTQNPKEADTESKCHSWTTEGIQAMQAKCSCKHTNHLYYPNEWLRGKPHYVKTYTNVNAAMQEYYLVSCGETDKVQQIDVSRSFMFSTHPHPDQKNTQLWLSSGDSNPSVTWSTLFSKPQN
ncbi:hypothetical protein CHS0354_026459 [Potamilus streckersoni]|uniref:Uncharacterized protein n=1 Tax=Potamilus streckersoni TaxID=2493646 RepID=A0AAE0RQ13_9BIVA|nr:hypothetical protein CHS0354_026459 [Potamilus streckersoni]